MNPRKIMIHIESLNDVPIRFIRRKENLTVKVWVEGFTRELKIDQVTVQVVKPEK